VRLGAARAIGLSLAVFANTLIYAPLAHGIYNGTSALGSRYVVKIVSAGATCSGALISSRIVATAAHCVIRAGKAVGAEQIRVYGAGVDLAASGEFVRVENFVYPSTFRNMNDSPEPNDIAFLVLSKDWGEVAIDGLADFNLTKEIIASTTPIEVYGYGSVKSQSESSTTPYLFTASVVEQLRYREFVGFERKYLNYRMDESGAACPGDSGGPAIAKYQGRVYLLSVSSGGSGPCNQKPEPTGSATATIAGEYLDLLDQAKKLLPAIKPPAPVDVTLLQKGADAQITWSAPIDPSRSITSFFVTNSQGNELCRTVTLTCSVNLEIGVNSLSIFAISGEQKSDEKLISVDIKLPVPEQISVKNSGAEGVIAWSVKEGFNRLISGFNVTDLQGQSVCLSTVAQCPVKLKAGDNTFLIKSVSKAQQSDAGVFTLKLKNAVIPTVNEIKVEKNSAYISWPTQVDVGDASATSVTFALLDLANRSTLCQAANNASGCRFALTKKNFTLGLQVTSDLGAGEVRTLGSFSGIEALARVSKIDQSVSSSSKKLAQLQLSDPGYKKELESLALKLPNLNAEFAYDKAALTRAEALNKSVMNLQSRISKSPRNVTITCRNTAGTKKFVGRNPKCPKGYKQITT
jgi:secreted trypsin-like serine protease